jgi:hypothetical protein
MRYLYIFIFINFVVIQKAIAQESIVAKYLDTIRTLVFQDTANQIRLIDYCKCDFNYIDSNMVVPNFSKDIHFIIRRIAEDILLNMTEYPENEFREFYWEFLKYYNQKFQSISPNLDIKKCYPFYWEIIDKYELINLVNKLRNLPDKEIYLIYKKMRINFIESLYDGNYILLHEPEYEAAKEINAPTDYGISIAYAPIIRRYLKEELKHHIWGDTSSPNHKIIDHYLRSQYFFLNNNPIPEIQSDIIKNIKNWADHRFALIPHMVNKIDNDTLLRMMMYEIVHNPALKGGYETLGVERNERMMEFLMPKIDKKEIMFEVLVEELEKMADQNEQLKTIKLFKYLPIEKTAAYLINYYNQLKNKDTKIAEETVESIMYIQRKYSKEIDMTYVNKFLNDLKPSNR